LSRLSLRYKTGAELLDNLLEGNLLHPSVWRAEDAENRSFKNVNICITGDTASENGP
jgi:hypothetical protein